MQDALPDYNDKSIPRDLRRMIKKVRRARIGDTYGPECQSPVEDIIVKCIKIQRLLDSSSEAIRKFNEDIKVINEQMNALPRPLSVRPVSRFGEMHQFDGKKAFDKFLDYSEVSEDEEKVDNAKCKKSKTKISKRKSRSDKGSTVTGASERRQV